MGILFALLQGLKKTGKSLKLQPGKVSSNRLRRVSVNPSTVNPAVDVGDGLDGFFIGKPV